MPENFDSREKWSKCESIKEVRDQSSCGSCWAFGATTAMSDRICIASGQKDQRRISPEDLMECCYFCGDGCNGGYLYQSWNYWKKRGIVTGGLYNDTATCKPYAFEPCAHHVHSKKYKDCPHTEYNTPSCKRKCNAKYGKEYNDDRIFGKSVYSVQEEHAMMKELVQNGPFEVAISVYSDFPTYKSGVY